LKQETGIRKVGGHPGTLKVAIKVPQKLFVRVIRKNGKNPVLVLEQRWRYEGRGNSKDQEDE